MKPFFSVIICSYNRSKLLPRALDSICNQLERDFEVVVVDDGSTDRTAEVVRPFVTKIPSLKCVRHEKNFGVGAARNTGIQNSIGRFVTFLDSDDEYKSNHLSSRKSILQQDRCVEFLHGGISVVGDPFVVDKDDFSKRIHVSNCAVGGTFFVQRDVFEATGVFKNLPYAEDAEFFKLARMAGINMHQTAEATYVYYRNVRGQLTEDHRKQCRRQSGARGWLHGLFVGFYGLVKSFHRLRD